MAKEIKEMSKDIQEIKKKGPATSLTSAVDDSSFHASKASPVQLGQQPSFGMDRARELLLRQMSQRPFVSMSVALGVGYLIGSIIPRRLEKYLWSVAGATALDWAAGRSLSQGGLKSGISDLFTMKGDSNEQFGRSH